MSFVCPLHQEDNLMKGCNENGRGPLKKGFDRQDCVLDTALFILELIDVTCTLLLLNPDFTTAWNVRKELILSGTLSPIKDLHLGKLALTKFPKSPETWIHRRWVLQQLSQETSLPSSVAKGNLGPVPEERTQRLIQEEMEVCSEAAGRYPSNYNAWSHRIWVLQNVAKLDLKTAMDASVLQHNSLKNEPKDEEATATTEEPRINLTQLLEEEVEFCTDLINSYPGHETLWCHR
ncbi:Protein prenyltransferase alpha subunit repeat-containing protein 1 [Cricetulus griseus]|nr:Protein prenyltransferase alpha subunit repeat-containing protein 1 [Cricetulus griseus]